MGEESGALPEEPHGLVQAAALGAASRARADAYLAEQIELTRLQIERERHDEKLRNWSQWVAHVSAVLKLAFEFVVALIVIVVGVALGAALWNAAHDDGLVIEAFSVPPDLANRGLTGEVVAGKVLDRLTELQFQTNSNRAASSYVNNWGSDIKVQIPETGVSIGQLYRYLAGWLGHETHITGEIYRDDQGIAVTARVGGAPPTTVRGTDAELDRLIQQSAEAVYRTTQPYRYAVFLDTHGKSAQARAIYNQLVAGQSLDDRAWAYIGLSAQRTNVADFAGANALLHKAMAIKPDILLIYANLAGNESSLQHDEQQLAYARKTLELSESGGRDTSMGANDARRIALQSRSGVAQAMGDLVEALSYNRAIAALPDENGTIESMRQNDATICAALHDRACFEAAVESFAPTTDALTLLGRAANIQQADIFFEDWNDAIAQSRIVNPALAKLPVGDFFLRRGEDPLLAAAYAGLGDFRTAEALAARMPDDCVTCLRTRARIAALQHRWREAEAWIARAARAAPSPPDSFADWGEIRLWRGDTAGAIANFEIAHAKGPHFADPLEMWGEALIARNRSDLAVAKFTEAAPYAPNWGRLHLKWGEALLWSGDKDGAKKQFAVAAGLFLSPADRATLQRLRAAHG
jgi:hypothetical protein